MSVRVAWGGVGAVALLQLVLSVAAAYDLNGPSMAAAAQDAIRLSRYKFPEGKPINTLVRVGSDGTVSQMDGCRHCGPRVHYMPEDVVPGVEYFFAELGVLDLPDADGRALMVHEWTHFLQYHAGAEWNTCAAEIEAVAVQNLFLAEQGLPPVPVWHPECGPVPITTQR